MMLGRRLLIFSVSAALHLGAVGLVLVSAGVGATSAILVDLVRDIAGEAMHHARPDASPRSVSAVSGRARRAVTPQAHPAVVPGHAVTPSGSFAARAPSGPEASPPALALEVERPADPPPKAGGARVPAAADTRTALTSPLEGATPGEDGAGVAGRVAFGVDDTGSRAGPARTLQGGLGAGSGTPKGSGDEGSPVALASVADAGGGGIPPEYGPYLRHFRRRVQESLEYPLAARRQGVSGSVELEVLLEPSGRVRSVRVLVSSSHAVLDEAALDTVKRLSAEPFPDVLPRRPLRIRLPLAFELH